MTDTEIIDELELFELHVFPTRYNDSTRWFVGPAEAAYNLVAVPPAGTWREAAIAGVKLARQRQQKSDLPPILASAIHTVADKFSSGLCTKSGYVSALTDFAREIIRATRS